MSTWSTILHHGQTPPSDRRQPPHRRRSVWARVRDLLADIRRELAWRRLEKSDW